MARTGSVDKNVKYQDQMYSRRQMRDTIEGPNAVKKSGEMYLPIPSSWIGATEDLPSTSASVSSRGTRHRLAPDYLPWWHPNPIYRQYLQRARFPDMVSASLRGMLGIAVKAPSKLELPKEMEYLKEEVSKGGESLEEFFGYCLSEVLSVGNVNIVVDVTEDLESEFYLTSYTAEATVDWETKRRKGTVVIDEICFVEGDVFEATDEYTTEIKYCLNEGVVTYKKNTDDEDEADVDVPMTYRGKPFDVIPVFCAGSVENVPDPQPIPLYGISDIAITIYQIGADLRQAQYLTCNPTLFVFGVSDKEIPTVIGSSVIIAVKNPTGQAMYPPTDTSALEHIRNDIQDLKKEAASYGANFIIGNQRESGEALGIKKAGQGVSMVQVVKQVGKAIQNALRFIARMKGLDETKVIYQPNTEFAEMYLSSNDLNSLVAAWMSGAFDHDTLIDNIRDAGIVKKDRTNQEIKDAIEVQQPLYNPKSDPKNIDNKVDEDKDESEDEDEDLDEDEEEDSE